MVTQDRLKQLLHYNQESGLFTWLENAPYKVRNKEAGSVNKDTGYVVIRIDRNLYQAHRLAWIYIFGTSPINFIDHINGNRTDNRIHNLRDVSRSTNNRNQRFSHINNESGMIGVTWYKPRKLWRARIVVNKKSKHLGLFESKQEAYSAYLVAKRCFHSDGCTI